ncbi:MAG TPA: DUF72 domain-containing protein [Pyrinomonadaceae bacterium]|jgi:uncharacterized protein YecE (DUF72 family)
MAIYVGTSGWSYDHWRGVLYPADASVGARLGFYTRHFQTVELNSSYYRWPRDAAFVRWRREVPENFLMTVKAPRGLTHGARLYGPERWVERIGRALAHLGPKRGVLLVQLPPQLAYDHARLDYFLRVLPAWLKVALEFRHPSWHREEVFGLLEARGAAYCVMSGAHLPCILRATAPFVYVRLHGPDTNHLYAGSYADAEMHWWAQRVREWSGMGRDVFVYFNNDGGGNAVRNAATLRRILGV